MSARRILLLMASVGAGSCMLLLLLMYNLCGIDHNGVLHSPPPVFTDETVEEATIVPSLPTADITLPYAIGGTSLIAERMVLYEGSFVENTDLTQMVITSGLLLRNTGPEGILHAVVTLERGEEILSFEVSSLPPGESVLVLEKEGRACFQQNFTACNGWETKDGSDWLQSDTLQITPVDMQTVSVTNLTNTVVKDICLYYKTVYADGLFYIGGITHEAKLEQLAPGETRLLRPEYYANIHSQIVRVSANSE